MLKLSPNKLAELEEMAMSEAANGVSCVRTILVAYRQGHAEIAELKAQLKAHEPEVKRLYAANGPVPQRLAKGVEVTMDKGGPEEVTWKAEWGKDGVVKVDWPSVVRRINKGAKK